MNEGLIKIESVHKMSDCLNKLRASADARTGFIQGARKIVEDFGLNSYIISAAVQNGFLRKVQKGNSQYSDYYWANKPVTNTAAEGVYRQSIELKSKAPSMNRKKAASSVGYPEKTMTRYLSFLRKWHAAGKPTSITQLCGETHVSSNVPVLMRRLNIVDAENKWRIPQPPNVAMTQKLIDATREYQNDKKRPVGKVKEMPALAHDIPVSIPQETPRHLPESVRKAISFLERHEMAAGATVTLTITGNQLNIKL